VNDSALLGAYGASTVTAYSPSGDLANQLTSNLAAAFAQMRTPLPAAYDGIDGLDLAYSYPRITGSEVCLLSQR
jgi:hypothetical protein